MSQLIKPLESSRLNFRALGFQTIRGTQTIDDKVGQSTLLSAANRKLNNEALGRIETYSCANMHSSACSMRSLDSTE